jgi:hypothetical protein
MYIIKGVITAPQRWWRETKVGLYERRIVWLVDVLGTRESELSFVKVRYKWRHDKAGFRADVMLDWEGNHIAYGVLEFRGDVVLEWKDGEVYRYHPGWWERVFVNLVEQIQESYEQARFAEYETRFAPHKSKEEDEY